MFLKAQNQVKDRSSSRKRTQFGDNERLPILARISHRLSTAAADVGPSASLCSLSLLGVLFKYACVAFGRKALHPGSHLCRLATIPHEKCGLEVFATVSCEIHEPK